jgi:hypothetical protein
MVTQQALAAFVKHAVTFLFSYFILMTLNLPAFVLQAGNSTTKFNGAQY